MWKELFYFIRSRSQRLSENRNHRKFERRQRDIRSNQVAFIWPAAMFFQVIGIVKRRTRDKVRKIARTRHLSHSRDHTNAAATAFENRTSRHGAFARIAVVSKIQKPSRSRSIQTVVPVAPVWPNSLRASRKPLAASSRPILERQALSGGRCVIVDAPSLRCLLYGGRYEIQTLDATGLRKGRGQSTTRLPLLITHTTEWESAPFGKC